MRRSTVHIEIKVAEWTEWDDDDRSRWQRPMSPPPPLSPNQFIYGRWRVCNLLSDSLWYVCWREKPPPMNMPVQRARWGLSTVRGALILDLGAFDMFAWAARTLVSVCLKLCRLRWLCGGKCVATFYLLVFSLYAFALIEFTDDAQSHQKLSVCDPEHGLCVPGTKIPAAIRSAIPSTDIAFHPFTSHIPHRMHAHKWKNKIRVIRMIIVDIISNMER